MDLVTLQYLNNIVGDIESTLDKIIEIQNELLGISNFENPITFYLDGTAYTANEGMTWGELINSPECPTIWQDCCQTENKLFYTGYDGEEDDYVYVDNCCGPPWPLGDLTEWGGAGEYFQIHDTIIPNKSYVRADW